MKLIIRDIDTFKRRLENLRGSSFPRGIILEEDGPAIKIVSRATDRILGRISDEVVIFKNETDK